MEWTIGWWQISVQRVYPTTTQLSQTYNRAASWWHQHLHLLGYRYADRELWRSLKNHNILPQWKDNSTICDCGIGTAFSLDWLICLSLITVTCASRQIGADFLDKKLIKRIVSKAQVTDWLEVLAQKLSLRLT